MKKIGFLLIIVLAIVTISCKKEPVASFSMSTLKANTGDIVEFRNTSLYCNSYSWNLGDGNTSTSFSVEHFYKVPGKYNITLTALSDEKSGEFTQTKSITIEGGEIDFFTDDRDNRTYKTVKVSEQWWMAENLNFVTTEGSRIYNDSIELGEIYGRVYNWETANSSAPQGWHLPTDEEWKTLINELGGSEIAGGEMKEAGYTHWGSPNTGATNNFSFSALPAGFCSDTCINLGYSASFWSANDNIDETADIISLTADTAGVFYSYTLKENLISVRYIKD